MKLVPVVVPRLKDVLGGEFDQGGGSRRTTTQPAMMIGGQVMNGRAPQRSIRLPAVGRTRIAATK